MHGKQISIAPCKLIRWSRAYENISHIKEKEENVHVHYALCILSKVLSKKKHNYSFVLVPCINILVAPWSQDTHCTTFGKFHELFSIMCIFFLKSANFIFVCVSNMDIEIDMYVCTQPK